MDKSSKPKSSDDKFSVSSSHFRIGSCTLIKDDSTSEILLESGKSLPLTQPESSILLCLYNNIGNVVRKHDLLVAGWGRPDIIGPNSLPVAMANIRKILSLAEIQVINVPRVGYKLEVPDKFEASKVPYDAPKTLTNTKYHDKISLILLFITTIVIIGLFIFTSLAWVRVECITKSGSKFCYNQKEKIESHSSIKRFPPDKRGIYFYQSGNWLKTGEVQYD